MSSLDAIMALEGGEIETEEQYAEALQVLIDDGIVWQLQGSYGRAARAAIEAGLCSLPEGV